MKRVEGERIEASSASALSWSFAVAVGGVREHEERGPLGVRSLNAPRCAGCRHLDAGQRSASARRAQ
jgi:hypothetical protein